MIGALFAIAISAGPLSPLGGVTSTVTPYMRCISPREETKIARVIAECQAMAGHALLELRARDHELKELQATHEELKTEALYLRGQLTEIPAVPTSTAADLSIEIAGPPWIGVAIGVVIGIVIGGFACTLMGCDI